MGIPLAPSAFTTLWEDEERFYKGYLKRFNGRWIDTGDAGMIDEDGYISIMSRADDVINVAAHRFSTGEHDLATDYTGFCLHMQFVGLTYRKVQ
jgi:propionyl-CoA synthetase